MTNIGNLRHRLSLEAPQRTEDEIGGASVTWLAQTSLWAAIMPRSGRENVYAAALASEVSHDIYLRDIPDITSGMRFRHDDRIFDIIAITGHDQPDGILQASCRERPA